MFFLILIFVEIFLGLTCLRFVGFGVTFLIYFLPCLLGMLFFSLQNQGVWLRFQREMAAGQSPDQQLIQMVSRFAGVVLLLVPSLLARSMAVLLLFPPTRFLLVKLGRTWLLHKLRQGSFRAFGGRPDFGANTGGFRYYDFSRGSSFEEEPRVERDAQVIDIEPIKLSSSSKDTTV